MAGGNDDESKAVTDLDTELTPVDRDEELLMSFVEIGEELFRRNANWVTATDFSRRITMESKRAISQILGYFQNRHALRNAQYNLGNILKADNLFSGLAKHLYHLDPFLYQYSYCNGIQEFVEAYALWIFFKEGRLLRFEELQEKLTFNLALPEAETTEGEDGSEPISKEKKLVPYQIFIRKTDYFLGLGDLPGELVRACTVGFANEDIKKFLFKSCGFVRALFQCLQLLHPTPKGMSNKLRVMRNSVMKLELLCYHATLRHDKIVQMIDLGLGLPALQVGEVLFEDVLEED